MKTIILDIDGTLTDMWPIEKAVLLKMLKKDNALKIESFYKLGIKDTFVLYKKTSKLNTRKLIYKKMYNDCFLTLQRLKQLPKPVKYPITNWIKNNKNRYQFVYATGGQQLETNYVLKALKLDTIINNKQSINKTNCKYSKITGIPFKKIKTRFPDCTLITDSDSDCIGATKAKIPFIKIKSGQKTTTDIEASI